MQDAKVKQTFKSFKTSENGNFCKVSDINIRPAQYQYLEMERHTAKDVDSTEMHHNRTRDKDVHKNLHDKTSGRSRANHQHHHSTTVCTTCNCSSPFFRAPPVIDFAKFAY